jgi:hypothetical protein
MTETVLATTETSAASKNPDKPGALALPSKYRDAILISDAATNAAVPAIMPDWYGSDMSRLIKGANISIPDNQYLPE